MRLIVIACLIFSQFAFADDTEKSPRDIIDEMEQLYRGESSDAKITMVVETPQYQRTMQMTGQSLGKEYGFFRILSPKKDRGIAGNVYKGRIMKVLPGMQAAFVDIGLEKSAFLYVGDVFDSTSEYAPMMDPAGGRFRFGSMSSSSRPRVSGTMRFLCTAHAPTHLRCPTPSRLAGALCPGDCGSTT